LATCLLRGRESILRMRCTRAYSSGMVLWSVLLPHGSEMDVTWSVREQGGGVRDYLPLRRGSRGYDVRVLG
jgi:hypothetical protein